jgi:hypothetical protein
LARSGWESNNCTAQTRPRPTPLEQWLRGLHAGYGDHIIDVDAAAAEEWGRLSVPDPLPVIDGLLAASAKIRGWTLVTRNTADVVRSGVALLDPFQPAAR